MNRTLIVSLALAATALSQLSPSPAAAIEGAAASAVPNASSNGTLITVPICKELNNFLAPAPAGFDIKKIDGTACEGWSCFYSYGMWSQGYVPRTVSWDRDATLNNVIDELCPCGVFDSCSASQEPRTVTMNASASNPVLMQITGEVMNITDSTVQAHVEYRAYKAGAGIPDAPLVLAIQVADGYGWRDVATRALPYDQSFFGNLYHSADLNASVPGNSQIRAELRWTVTQQSSPYMPAYTFNLKAASLFGAQCFPSPDPNSVMCQ